MTTVAEIAQCLERLAPAALAADWDNVGLLMGDRQARVTRLMTCLTITADSAAEAADEKADLVVAHHPLPFRPLRRLTTETQSGELLWRLARAGVAIYSPHTAFDSASDGINQRLAAGLGLQRIVPLEPRAEDPSLGVGRWGHLPTPLALRDLVARVKQFLGISGLQWVGPPDAPIERVAVGCGSAGELLQGAHQAGCQCFVTGEARFHACLEAEALGMTMILPGHFASERFGVERLADVLAAQFAQVHVWASQRERDPLQFG